MRRHATTILLVLAALVLGTWLWLDRDRVTEGERKRRENNVFTAWRREDLARVVISHEGETLTLERDAKRDSTWRLTSPRAERADVAAVERLLTTLEFAVIVRKVGEGTPALGFEAPRATGEIHMGAMVTRFALGGPSPRPEGSSYMRVGDGAPFVASKELTATLLAPSDTYRDRTVVPYLSLDLARLELRHPGGAMSLERLNDHAFKVAELGVVASRGGVDKIWAALAEMRAETFPKETDVDRLTAAPRLTIRMTPKDAGKPAAELVVGDACPGHPEDVIVLRRAPDRVAACAPKGALDALLAKPEAIADRRPFSVRMDEIEELRLESLGGEPRAIEAARKGTGYHLRFPADRDLEADEADALTELLGRIADAEADKVTRGGEPFVAVARARVRFGGDREQTVEVGAANGGRAVVRRVLDDARLDVSAEVARRLLPRETSLRPRRILPPSDRRITRLLLRCGTPQELVDRGEGLRLVEPKGFETDASVLTLVNVIEKGKIVVWTADSDDGSFGFDAKDANAKDANAKDANAKDECRAVVGFEDGNAPATVSLGAPCEGGFYAKVDTRPGVFIAPESLRALMSGIYVNRAALRTEPSRVERVRATYKGKPVERDPAVMREVAGELLADRVVALGRAAVTALPDAELVLEVTVAEGGPSRRVACGAPSRAPPGPAGSPGERAARLCTVDGVLAVFAVRDSAVARLLPEGTAPPAPSARPPAP